MEAFAVKKKNIVLSLCLLAFCPISFGMKKNIKSGAESFEIIKKSLLQKNFEKTYEMRTHFWQLVNEFTKKRTEKLDNAKWLGKKDWKKNNYIVQKLTLNAEKEPVVKFMTDIHGYAKPLVNIMEIWQKEGFIDKKNPFKIKKKNGYIVFLGDYTDRGKRGMEVLSIVMQLYLNNPDQVVVIRGNHEDCSINSSYGFANEFKTNVNEKNIQNMYNTLTCMCYLTWEDKAILCTHGGPDLRYNAKNLLANKTATYELVDKEKKIKDNLTKDFYNSLLSDNTASQHHLEDLQYYKEILHCSWTMFHDLPFFYDRENMQAYLSPRILKSYLKQNSTKKIKINAIIRGHQHADFYSRIKKGNGAYVLWQDKQFKKNGTLSLNELNNHEKKFCIFFTKNQFKPVVITVGSIIGNKVVESKKTVLGLQLKNEPQSSFFFVRTNWNQPINRPKENKKLIKIKTQNQKQQSKLKKVFLYTFGTIGLGVISYGIYKLALWLRKKRS